MCWIYGSQIITTTRAQNILKNVLKFEQKELRHSVDVHRVMCWMYGFQHSRLHTLNAIKCYYIKQGGEGGERVYCLIPVLSHIHWKAFRKAFLCSFFTETIITTPFDAPLSPPLPSFLVTKTLVERLIIHAHSPIYF